jgi:hypothetical protein
MAITRMRELKHIKPYGRYRSVHRRALVGKSLKLLDDAEANQMSFAEIAKGT